MERSETVVIEDMIVDCHYYEPEVSYDDDEDEKIGMIPYVPQARASVKKVSVVKKLSRVISVLCAGTCIVSMLVVVSLQLL